MPSSFFTTVQPCLTVEDFSFFTEELKQFLVDKLGGFGAIWCVDSLEKVTDSHLDDQILRNKLSSFFSNDSEPAQPMVLTDYLLLPFILSPVGRLVLIVSGLDPFFLKSVAVDWLRQVGEELMAYLLLEKKGCWDELTGCYTSSAYFHHLPHTSASTVCLLVEVAPLSRAPFEARRYALRAVKSLRAFLGGLSQLFAFGFHLYGIHFSSGTIEPSLIARRIIAWMRKDGFKQVHIGFCEYDSLKGANEVPAAFEHALARAREMGPYAYCDYAQLMHPETHPFVAPNEAVVQLLKKRWRDCSAFSVLLISFPDGDTAFDESNEEYVLADGDSFYLLRTEESPDESLAWLTGILSASKTSNYYAGLSYYPCGKLSRTAVLKRSSKALQHARLLGMGSIAVFDNVSCNVAGDLYYQQGDLRAAIREYREGLLYEPDDTNLLNSLGVAYADIGRSNDSQRCFEQVLALEPDNFMALYNLAQKYDLVSDIEKAILYYKRAEQTITTEFPEAVRDVQFQLGRLFSLNDQYDAALEYLRPWYENEEQERGRCRALPYLGRAFFYTGNYNEAVLFLQRALQLDGYDSVSMGLLGYAYYCSGQGEEVACSLCRKSLELDPKNKEIRLYLARILLEIAQPQAARETVRPCLSVAGFSCSAQVVVCKSYLAEGNLRRARFWFQKLHGKKENDPQLTEEIRKIATIISEKRKTK